MLNEKMVDALGDFDQGDIWISKIFPFLGMGHYAMVAGVCKELKEWYKAYCASVECPPRVWNFRKYVRVSILATTTSTFYGSVFATVACAEYWYTRTHGTLTRKLRAAVCSKAARAGSIDVMRWALQMGFTWDENTCATAAGCGYLEMVRWLHHNGCPWDASTCTEAAAGGHLEVIKYAHDNGCPWNSMTYSNAAENCNFEVIRYAHENGCPRDAETCNKAASAGNLKLVFNGIGSLALLLQNLATWTVSNLPMKMVVHGIETRAPKLQEEATWTALSLPMKMVVHGMKRPAFLLLKGVILNA
eukprot:Sro1869_g302640.1 ankyrin repeat protein (303) ;mRNA; f:7109-8123